MKETPGMVDAMVYSYRMIMLIKEQAGGKMITKAEAAKAFKTIGEYCLENECEKCIFGIFHKSMDDIHIFGPCIFGKGNEPYCIPPRDIQKVYSNANIPEEE